MTEITKFQKSALIFFRRTRGFQTLSPAYAEAESRFPGLDVELALERYYQACREQERQDLQNGVGSTLSDEDQRQIADFARLQFA